MKALRIGLCVLFAFSVLAHGVVEVWSESVLEMGASALLLVWAILVYRDSEIGIQWSPLNWPFLGFIVIGLLQFIFHWTANPFFTRVELLRFGAYFLIFFLAAQAFREREDLVKLAWFLVILGFSASLLGIIQYFYVSEHDLLVPASFAECRCVWPLRESQSLRRIRRAGCACRISSDGVSRRPPGPFPVDWPAHDHPGWRADSRGFARRHHLFCI
jgi:hypothetical protein